MLISPYHGVQLVLGLSIWIIWFAFLYSALSLGCVFAAPAPEAGAVNWLNLSLFIVTGTTVALLILFAVKCWRAANGATQSASRLMIARLGAAVHGVAAVATLSVGATTLVLPPCV